MSSNEEIVSLRCDRKHIFHKQCIIGWLDQNKSCPICRSERVLDESSNSFDDEDQIPDESSNNRPKRIEYYLRPVEYLRPNEPLGTKEPINNEQPEGPTRNLMPINPPQYLNPLNP